MAAAIVRSGLRAALRGGASSKRAFSSSSSVEYEARESRKWERVTYVGAVSCTVLAIAILSKGHAHYEDPPAYPYLHIRNKEFPWGPDGLFEVKEHH